MFHCELFYISVNYILQLHPVGNYSSLLNLYSNPMRQVIAILPYKESWCRWLFFYYFLF